MKKTISMLLFAMVTMVAVARGQSGVESESGPLPPPDMTLNRASTVIHPDETRTVTLYDAEKRQSDVRYFNADGSWRAHIVYTLDESNRAKLGQFLDRKGKPGVRALYRYNDQDQVVEETHYNPKGALLRRMVYEYGLAGRVVKSVTYDPQGNMLRVYRPKKISIPGRPNQPGATSGS